MENVNLNSQNNYVGLENNKKDSHTFRNTVLGALGTGTVTTLASRANEPSEDKIILKMKENDVVKKHIEDSSKLKTEIETNLIDEFAAAMKELNAVWNKKAEGKELLKDDIEVLKKHNLPENISADNLKRQFIKKMSDLRVIKKTHNELANESKMIIECIIEVFNAVNKFISNKSLNKNELDTLSLICVFPEDKIKLTAENLNKFFCEKHNLDPTKATSKDLATAIVKDLKSGDTSIPEKINTINNLINYEVSVNMQEIEKNLSVKKAFDEKVNNIFNEKIHLDILNSDSLKAVKEDAAKTLKNKKLMTWAAVGTLAGGIIVGALSHFDKKSDKKAAKIPVEQTVTHN
jgi:hypothetical protein